MKKAVNTSRQATLGVLVKEESEWDGECGVSEAAARAGLYVKHEVKKEVVLGPELYQVQDIVYRLQRKTESLIKEDNEFVKKEETCHHARNEPILDPRCIAQLLTTCHVPLHRLPEEIHPRGTIQQVISDNCHTDTGSEHVDDDTDTESDMCDDDAFDQCTDPEKITEDEVFSDTGDVKTNVTVPKRKKAIRKSYQKRFKEKKAYRCETCGEEFTAKKKLKAHASKHRVKKTKPKVNRGKYACNACGRRFVDNKNLLLHMLVHMGLQPFTCRTCDSKFSCQSRLERHERMHTGEKPFVCDICGKCFSRKSSLTNHILVHMGGKPYTCEICQKNFQLPRYLALHKLSHSDVKNHSCDVCNQKFVRLSYLKLHKKLHAGLKEICCEICGKTFVGLDKLRKHHLIHEGVKPYPCQYCRKKFRTKWALRSHTRKVHNNGNRENKIISESLKSSNLKEACTEMTTNSNEKLCATDNKVDPNETAIIHSKSGETRKPQHPKETPPLNTKTKLLPELNSLPVDINASQTLKNTPVFTSKNAHEHELYELKDNSINYKEPLENHKDNHKSQSTRQSLVAPENTNQSDKTLNYELKYPGNNDRYQLETPQSNANTLNSSRDILNYIEIPLETSAQLEFDVQTSETSPTCHEIIDLISTLADTNGTEEPRIKVEFSDDFAHIQKPYSCDTCGKRYGEKKHLIPHCRAHLDDLCCVVCHKTYTHSVALERHLIKAHIEKAIKYTCEICGAEMSSLHSLARHESVHTTGRRHRCNICKKRFKQLYDLRKHLRTHTGEKPFKCDVCNIHFGQQGNLSRHKRIHEAKKLYPCDICGKHFARRAYAELHRKIHTGEKLYQCEICEKQFLHQNSYASHVQSHIGPREKTFACETCDAKYTRPGHLKRHMQTHTGFKPYSCDLCEKRFYTKTHLKRHVNSQKRPCVD